MPFPPGHGSYLLNLVISVLSDPEKDFFTCTLHACRQKCNISFSVEIKLVLPDPCPAATLRFTPYFKEEKKCITAEATLLVE